MLLQEALLPAAYFLGKFRRVEPELVVLADAHHDRRPESLDRLARGGMVPGFWKDEPSRTADGFRIFYVSVREGRRRRSL